jgi:hypothetical protein
MYQVYYTSQSKLLNSSYNGAWRSANSRAAMEHLKWNASRHGLNNVNIEMERDGTFLYQAESSDLMFTAIGMPVENTPKTYVEDFVK